jgi:hypothetical protein
VRFVRGLRRRWRGPDAAPPPRSDYLWNPADPRSFQALRESGGAAAMTPRPRARRPAARNDAAPERLDPLEQVPGAGIRRAPRRRVVVGVVAACALVAAALIVVSVVAPEGAPAGGGAAPAETDPDTASQDEATAAAPTDGTTAPPTVTAAEAEAQYLQTVRDVAWKVRGQLESIFAEGLRYPGPGNWHWARRDDRAFARPIAAPDRIPRLIAEAGPSIRMPSADDSRACDSAIASISIDLSRNDSASSSDAWAARMSVSIVRWASR